MFTGLQKVFINVLKRDSFFLCAVEVNNFVSRNLIDPAGKGEALMSIASQILPDIEKDFMSKIFGFGFAAYFQVDKAVNFRHIVLIEFLERSMVACLSFFNIIMFCF